MTERVKLGEHFYADGREPDEKFSVVRIGARYFWEFSPAYRLAGPFLTEQAAIEFGKKFLNPDGTKFFN